MKFLQMKLLAPVGFMALLLMWFSGTDAGGRSPGRGDIAIAGHIPPPVVEALSEATGARVQDVPYAGSLGIVDLLRRGIVEFGAITSDTAYLSFAGRLNKDATPFDQLRGITVLELKTVHLIIRRGARARSMAELGGLNVSLGPPRTGTSLISELLLKAHGLTLDDIEEEYVPIPEAAKRLIAGDLDAAFIPSVSPAAEVVLAAGGGAQLLEIEGPKVEELRLQYPFLRRARLPEGSYPGQQTLIHTIAVDLLLVCRADTHDEVVYDFLQAYFTALARKTAVIDLNRATAISIPLHAGAARYYREREISR